MSNIGSKMPRAGSLEENGFQAIFPGLSGSKAFNSASAELADIAPANCTVVKLYATRNCFIKIAPSAPIANTTTCYYLPVDKEVLLGLDPGAHIAVIAESAPGVLYYSFGEGNG